MSSKDNRLKRNRRLPRSIMFGLVTVVAMIYSGILTGLIDRSANDLMVMASDEEVSVTVSIDETDVDTDGILLDQQYPRYYVTDTCDLLESSELLSASIGQLHKRDMVYVLDEDEETTYVMTADGYTGYIHANVLNAHAEEIFDDTNEQYYLNADTVLKNRPYDNAEDAVEGIFNQPITVIGKNDHKYMKAMYGDQVVYVTADVLMDEEYVEPQVEESKPEYTEPQSNPSWNGQVLTAFAGTIIGPSGKETYYNLPMGGVISIMQGAGYNYDYWVRDDGVKMYGDYVMAACSFDIRPRGSIVETSLGTAICADTGTFAYSNQTQIDIAVNW